MARVLRSVLWHQHPFPGPVWFPEKRDLTFSVTRCLSPACHGLHCIPTNSGQPRTSSHGYSEWVLDLIFLTFRTSSTLRDNYKMLSGFQGGSDGKEFACNTGDGCLIHGWGRSPGEGNGNPLQYSCLGNLMDRGTWLAMVQKSHRSQKCQTQSTGSQVLDTNEWPSSNNNETL